MARILVQHGISYPMDSACEELWESNNATQCVTCNEEIDKDEDTYTTINGEDYHVTTKCMPWCPVCENPITGNSDMQLVPQLVGADIMIHESCYDDYINDQMERDQRNIADFYDGDR